VIGGLLFGTAATLAFVPVVFGTVHAWLNKRSAANATSVPTPQAS
jgi:hypothetical protein